MSHALPSKKPAERGAACERDEVERPAIQRGLVGRGCRRSRLGYPDVELTNYHVDALAARFITAPDSLDVVVASNLFGDILTDLGGHSRARSALPAGQPQPRARLPSCSSRSTARLPTSGGPPGIANPMAAIWAGALMLEHLGEQEA